MNAKRVSAAADLIHRAQENGKRTAAGIAADLDAACMLQSPEVAAELANFRTMYDAVSAREHGLIEERDTLRARVAELEIGQAQAKNDAAQARRELALIRERVSEPFGCTHCGVTKRGHGRRYISGVGMHAWERPTDEQVKDRMLARRAARAPWPGKLELDRAHEELIGEALSLYEEEQENARLRLALKSAQRGRQQLRAQVAALLKERHRTNEWADDAAKALRANRDRIAELEKERARYVGAEPTIAEELAYLSRCLDSVLAWCEKTEARAPELVAEVRAAAEGMVERTSYPPALPWARLMDDEDLAEFLDDLALALEAAEDLDALAEVEDACARWRLIAEAQHGHNTAPGPGEEIR
ncbi:hypothetical protein AB0E62_37135 [Streptomyces sp. NPDC038707]|uniref:hypothetical protein n=1 Tax=Streptomyces sp. NPDC038707 TaxID=3154329 RepID=UPI00340D27BA